MYVALKQVTAPEGGIVYWLYIQEIERPEIRLCLQNFRLSAKFAVGIGCRLYPFPPNTVNEETIHKAECEWFVFDAGTPDDDTLVRHDANNFLEAVQNRKGERSVTVDCEPYKRKR